MEAWLKSNRHPLSDWGRCDDFGLFVVEVNQAVENCALLGGRALPNEALLRAAQVSARGLRGGPETTEDAAYFAAWN